MAVMQRATHGLSCREQVTVCVLATLQSKVMIVSFFSHSCILNMCG